MRRVRVILYAQTILAHPDALGAATLWNDLAEASTCTLAQARGSSTALSPRLTRDIIPDGGGAVDVKNAPSIIARLLRDRDWAVWGTNASAADAGDFSSMAQSTTVQEALSRIPKSWKLTQQKGGIGDVFTNPDATALVTEVRIKVPQFKFNKVDSRLFAQLRLGKNMGRGYPGADDFGMLYYDRNLQLTTNNDAMHIRLDFNR